MNCNLRIILDELLSSREAVPLGKYTVELKDGPTPSELLSDNINRQGYVELLSVLYAVNGNFES